jgi:hypothetical protein
MHHGIRTFIFGLCIIVCCGCSPTHRFYRLVTRHPYLLDSITKTEILVRERTDIDTQFVLQNKIDTFIIDQVKIERKYDTFRILLRERLCTTYVHTTEIKPSKIIERHYEKTLQKGFSWSVFKVNLIWIIVTLALIILLRRN